MLIIFLMFYTGEESIDGILTEKWILNETIGQKLNKYTMWLQYKTDPNKPNNSQVAVPIKYEMRGYNSLLGSHYDHYYLEYDAYDVNDISPDTFELKPGKYPNLTSNMSLFLTASAHIRYDLQLIPRSRRSSYLYIQSNGRIHSAHRHRSRGL